MAAQSLAFRDLLPNTFNCMKKQESAWRHALAVVIGLAVMLLVGFAL